VADRSEDLTRLRRADSTAKAARVLAALDAMVTTGESPVIAILARKASVSRRFIYDHPELRAEVDRRAAEVADHHAMAASAGVRVTTASLRADLENSKARNHRLEMDLAALRRRLGEMLGQSVLDESSGADLLVESRAAGRRVEELEHELFETQELLMCRTEELEAARQINRELMARLNRE
jgi:hypothetical protein